MSAEASADSFSTFSTAFLWKMLKFTEKRGLTRAFFREKLHFWFSTYRLAKVLK